MRLLLTSFCVWFLAAGHASASDYTGTNIFTNATNTDLLRVIAGLTTFSGGSNSGTLQADGGALTLTGNIDNTGGLISRVSGTLTFDDALITGGTFSGNASGTHAGFEGTMFTSGTLSLGDCPGGCGNGLLNFSNGGTVISTAGGISFDGGMNTGIVTSTGGLMVFSNNVNNTGGTINGSGGLALFSDANITGGAITDFTSWVGTSNTATGILNTGTVTVGSLTTISNSVNQGIMEVNSGGTLILNGTLNNSGGTLDAHQGTLQLAGATVTGGSLSVPTGSTLGIGAGSSIDTSSGTFSSVGAGGVLGGGTHNLAGNLNYAGTQNITIIAPGAAMNLAPGGSLTNANGNALDGSLSNIYGSLNLGTGSLATAASGFINNGFLGVGSGAAVTVTGGARAFVNYNEATHTLTGGSYDIYGSFNVAGMSISSLGGDTIVNLHTGATFTGFDLEHLSVIAGELQISNDVFDWNPPTNITAGGELNIFDSEINLPPVVIQVLTLDNEGKIVVQNSRVSFGGVNNYGEIDLEGPTRAELVGGELNNYGNLFIEDISRAEVVDGNFAQYAGQLFLDGVLVTKQASIKAGVVAGNGIVQGNLDLSGGTLSPGHSPGTFTVSGDYVQGNALLLMQIADLLTFDQLWIGGNADLGGTLDLDLLGGYVPLDGSIFKLLSWGTHSGTFAAIDAPNVCPTCSWDFDYRSDGFYAGFNNSAATPEPGTWAMLLGAVGVLAANRRRLTHPRS